MTFSSPVPAAQALLPAPLPLPPPLPLLLLPSRLPPPLPRPAAPLPPALEPASPPAAVITRCSSASCSHSCSALRTTPATSLLAAAAAVCALLLGQHASQPVQNHLQLESNCSCRAAAQSPARRGLVSCRAESAACRSCFAGSCALLLLLLVNAAVASTAVSAGQLLQFGGAADGRVASCAAATCLTSAVYTRDNPGAPSSCSKANHMQAYPTYTHS
jgi:hypothetical protein